MIFGVGTDLTLISRVDRLWVRYGEHFVDKILMPEELAEFDPSRRAGTFLAKRFAVKEAFVKALGTGFRDGVTHHDVGYVQDARSRPSLVYSPAMRQRLAALGIVNGQVSLSDEDGRVLAFVVLERAAP